MSALVDSSLYSAYSVIGWAWTMLTFYLMLSVRGSDCLRNPRTIVVTAISLFIALWIVTRELEVLTQLSTGIVPLDIHFGYGQADIAAFASALGADGRRVYAAFQLGQDALAPPAFACFLMSAYRSTVKSLLAQKFCTVLAAIYFSSVLLANHLMPVIILNFPQTNGLVLTTLYHFVPACDGIKYTSHALAWMVIIAAWLWQLKIWTATRLHAK